LKEVLIGLASGIISGIGMGGGTALIFLLSTICGIEQHIAQASNLIFFIPTSISAIIVNIKNKNADLKLTGVISICGVVGAIIGASISIKTNVSSLRKYFGIFLAVIAIHEIYAIIKEYINEKNTHNKHQRQENS
jgi:hypothetical protein